MTSSANPLRELDDDPFRPADVAKPIEVFVTLHLADEVRATGSQAGDHGVDVVDRACDVPDAWGVRGRMPVAVRALGCMELHQFEATVAVWALHHRDLNPDSLEPHNAVHPIALDQAAALQFESDGDEERRRGPEVFDHDPDVVHSLDRHDSNDSERPALPLRCLGPGYQPTVGRSSRHIAADIFKAT